MKAKDPLAAALSELSVPTPSPAARERALHRATIALRQSATGSISEPLSFPCGSAWRGRMVLSFAFLAALSLAVLFSRRDMPDQGETLDTSSRQTEQIVLRQVEAVFGPQLNGVVQRAGAAPDVCLSEDIGQGAAGLAQPVVVEFTRGKDTVRVLGYSGRAVCVELAGRRTCFEPMVTGNGKVILAGEKFCWTPRDRAARLSGYRIATSLL